MLDPPSWQNSFNWYSVCKRFPKKNSTLAQFCIKWGMFLLVHISITVQNQLQLLPCQKSLILQHLPHHHFYKAYKKPLRHQVHSPSDQSVQKRGLNKQQKYWIFLIVRRDGKLCSGESEIIQMCVTAPFSHTQPPKQHFPYQITLLYIKFHFLNFHWNVTIFPWWVWT